VSEDADRLIQRARGANVQAVASRVAGLESAREKNKWSCPVCGSSDALHVYEDGARCYSGKHPDADRQMDGIALVQASLGCGFKEAVEEITGERWPKNVNGSDKGDNPFAGGSDTKSTPKRAPVRATTPPKKKNLPTTTLLERLVDVLELDEKGKAYLDSRSIDPECASHLGIVSCSKSAWRSYLGRVENKDLLRYSGLLVKDGSAIHPFYDHFLVFPYFSDDGLETVRFRCTDTSVHPKMMSVCSPGPTSSQAPYCFDSVPWAKHEPSTGGVLFVVEGELDALSCIELGFAAVSTYSASVWPKQWCLGWRGLQVVVVAEGDEAGDSFADRVIDASVEVHGLDWTLASVSMAKLGRGDDLNDLKMQGNLGEKLGMIVDRLT